MSTNGLTNAGTSGASGTRGTKPSPIGGNPLLGPAPVAPTAPTAPEVPAVQMVPAAPRRSRKTFPWSAADQRLLVELRSALAARGQGIPSEHAVLVAAIRHALKDTTSVIVETDV